MSTTNEQNSTDIGQEVTLMSETLLLHGPPKDLEKYAIDNRIANILEELAHSGEKLLEYGWNLLVT